MLNEQLQLVELNVIAKPKNKYIEYMGVKLHDMCVECKFVGSRVTCSPAPMDTDLDILCLVTDEFVFLKEACVEQGWEFSNNDYEMVKHFTSIRCGEVNIIVTIDPSFYKKFAAACDLCKALNLMDKKQRIAVHDAFLEFE